MYSVACLIFTISLIAFISFGFQRNKAKKSNLEIPKDVSKGFKNSLITMVIALIVALISQPSDTIKSETKTQSNSTVETPAKVEEQKPTPVTLKLTPKQFQEKFNQVMHSGDMGTLGTSGTFDIGEPQLKVGSVQDVVQYQYQGLEIILQENVDKTTGEVKEIWVLVAGKAFNNTELAKSNLLSAVMIYVASIKATNPNLKPDETQKIQGQLGMNAPVSEWINNTSTTYQNIEYTKQFSKEVGMMFTISAK